MKCTYYLVQGVQCPLFNIEVCDLKMLKTLKTNTFFRTHGLIFKKTTRFDNHTLPWRKFKHGNGKNFDLEKKCIKNFLAKCFFNPLLG